MEGRTPAGEVEMQDLIEVAPHSPTSSTPFSDAALPPSSEASVETTDVENPAGSGYEGRQTAAQGGDKLRTPAQRPVKRVKGLEDDGDGEYEPPRRWRTRRARESDDSGGEDRAIRSQ